MVSVLLWVTFACRVVIAVSHVVNRQFAAPVYDVLANLIAFGCAVAASLLLGHWLPAALSGFLRNGETTKFLIALSELAEIDFHTARRILEKRELDALAIVCKAADLDRSLFLTFAVLALGRDAEAMGRAREYGQLYSELPRDAACRTIRFWQMRRQSGDVAAA